MTSAPVLVTGASGFIGRCLTRGLLTAGLPVLAVGRRCLPAEAGLENRPWDAGLSAKPADVVGKTPLRAIIHLAANSSQAACEAAPQAARQINVDATLAWARIAWDRQLPFIFTSTDQVFSGQQGNYRETDSPATNLPVYGQTKHEAEDLLSELFHAKPELLTIFRLALTYGPCLGDRLGPVGWIIRNLQTGEPVQLFVDEFRSPLYVDDLTRACCQLLEQPLGGLYHLGGPERWSRYDMGVRIANHLNLPHDLIRSVSVAEYTGPVSRSPDCSLNIDLFTATFGWAPRGLAAGLEDLKTSQNNWQDIP